MKKVVVFSRPGQSLLDKLESKVEVCLWDYDVSGRLSNPEFKKISVEYRIPTVLSKTLSHDHLKRCVDQYIAKVIEVYGPRLSKVMGELSEIRGGTKKWAKLERERQVLDDFLEDITRRIRLEGPFRRGKSSHRAYHLVTPFLPKKLQMRYLSRDFKIDSAYNAVSRQVRYALGFPFGVLEEKTEPTELRYDVEDGEISVELLKNVSDAAKRVIFEPTGEKAKLEHLLGASTVTFDYETHNWRRIRMQEELADHPEDELKQMFLQAVEEYSVSFDTRLLKWMDKMDYIRSIETIINENKGEMLTIGSTDDKNFTVMDCGEEELDIEEPHEPGKFRKARMVVVKDQEQIVVAQEKYIADVEPFYIQGFNHPTFDIHKALELVGHINFGVDGREPLFLGQIPGGFKRFRIFSGRINIDPCSYGQKAMRTYNNRMDTHFEHHSGVRSLKTLTHGGLFEKSEEYFSAVGEGPVDGAVDDVVGGAVDDVVGGAVDVSRSNVANNNLSETAKKAAKECNYYAQQDVRKTEIITDNVKLEHILLAEASALDTASISLVSYDTIAENYWVFWHWRRKHTYPRKDFQNMRFDVDDEARKKLGFDDEQITYEKFSCTEFMHKQLKIELEKTIRSQKALCDGVLVEFFPFACVFREMLERDPLLQPIYGIIDSDQHAAGVAQTDHIKLKSRLLRALEGIAKFPLFMAIDSTMSDNLFSGVFELGYELVDGEEVWVRKSEELKRYKAKVSEAVDFIAGLIGKYGLLNTNRDVFVFPEEIEEDDLNSIVDKGIGVVKGKGKFLSGSKGRFACNINGFFNMYGIADYKSRRGERCDFEKEFYENFLQLVVIEGDVAKATNYLVRETRLLAEGKMSYEKLVYEKEASRDHSDYNDGATAAAISKMVEFQTREGELVRYTYPMDKMMEKFFGLPSTKHSSQLKVYDDYKETLGKYKTDLTAYNKHQRSLGSKKGQTKGMEIFPMKKPIRPEEVEAPNIKQGTISTIVEWIFDFKDGSEGDMILKKIYRGRGTDEDVKMLMVLNS